MSIAGNFVTTIEAARILNVSEIRVRQFFKQNRIAGQRVGRQILLEEESVSEFNAIVRRAGRPSTQPKQTSARKNAANKKSSRKA